MKISEIGEFGLIDLLAGMVESSTVKESDASRQLIHGIGDDAAAWEPTDSIQLATVDALVQNVHFTLEMTTWEELGWKALAVNLSDIAAMGGIPRYALISLALPGGTEVDDVTSLYRGMIDLATRFEVVIVGGNMSSAPMVNVHVTVTGSANNRDQLLMRSAARPGQKIAVTGCLGAAAAGLEMLSKRMLLDRESTSILGRAFVRPQPRVAEGRILVEQGVRTGIDISDGLLSDLRHICDASRVGARIDTARVPVHPAVQANFGSRALEMAISGGEDYELLFTADDGVLAKVTAAVSCPVTIIGEVTDEAGQVTLVDAKGKPLKIQGAGWNHFARK